MTYPLFSGCPLATNVTNNMTMTEIVRGFNYDVYKVAVPRLLSSSTLSVAIIMLFWGGLVYGVDSHKLGVRFCWGTTHVFAHVTCAVGIAVLIDTIFAHLASHGNLGDGALSNQWDLFEEKFSGGDESLLFNRISYWTAGVVPTVLRYSMYVADSPQTQYLVRSRMCNSSSSSSSTASSFSSKSDLDSDQLTVVYFFLRGVWYWIIACPLISTVVAVYLWLSVGYLGLHWNEGFSSLQHDGYKNFVRMKITRQGDLEMYAIGVEKTPKKWTLDPEREKKEMVGGGGGGTDADDVIHNHRLKRPSKWVAEDRRGKPSKKEIDVRIVDHCVIKGVRRDVVEE